MRYAASAILLFAGALLGLGAWTIDTCTGNAPDSLVAAPLVLLLNLAGFGLLCFSARAVSIGIVALLPALSACRYSMLTAQLASGVPACQMISGNDGWEQTADHSQLVMIWIATSLSFWLGLAIAMWRAIRRADEGTVS